MPYGLSIHATSVRRPQEAPEWFWTPKRCLSSAVAFFLEFRQPHSNKILMAQLQLNLSTGRRCRIAMGPSPGDAEKSEVSPDTRFVSQLPKLLTLHHFSSRVCCKNGSKINHYSLVTSNQCKLCMQSCFITFNYVCEPYQHWKTWASLVTFLVEGKDRGNKGTFIYYVIEKSWFSDPPTHPPPLKS